jgi:hypothetical protein
MLSLATLIFLPHLLLNPVWQFYFVTPFAVLAVMAATAVSKLGQLSPPGLGKLVIPSVVAGLLVLEGVHFAAAFPDPITGFNTADPSLLKYHEVADYLRSTVPADKQIVSFDVGIVLEADRRLAPGLEMSLLSYWPGLQTARARHFGVLNTPLFEQVVSDSNSGALAFTDGDLVFIERALPPGPEPTFKSVEEMILGVVPGAEGKYRLARTFPGFPQEPGNLYVLLRNN